MGASGGEVPGARRWWMLTFVAMSDDVSPCGEPGVYPLTGMIVRCGEPAGHRIGMHRHGKPEMMYWPVEQVTCPAWKTSPTAMGDVVLRCAIPAARHKPLRHESKIGIQIVAWTDAELGSVGVIAEKVYKLIQARGYDAGEKLPSNSDLGGKYGVSPTTVAEAMHLLARDGVVKRRGPRAWVKS
jgi:Bacterial regulatory proteins, gntR family